MEDSDDPELVIEQLREALLEDSLSTCYSGIESAHTATNCIAYALSELTGEDMTHVPLYHMIEWDVQNRKELLLMSDMRPNCCLFADVAGFFREELLSTIEQLKETYLSNQEELVCFIIWQYLCALCLLLL